MNSYVKMKFGTNSGKDLTITVSNVKDNLDVDNIALIQEAMTLIEESDAISGDHMGITSSKEAILYKVTTESYKFSEESGE